MPSKKPIMRANTEQWIIDKMKYIAEKNSRSLAKEIEYLCKKHIDQYEADHGEIKITEEGGGGAEITIWIDVNTIFQAPLEKLRINVILAPRPKRQIWEEHLPRSVFLQNIYS